MSNGFSRRKGKRGELDVVHKLGGSARRTGHAFLSKPDITSDWAVFSVKNKNISGNTIVAELEELQKQAPQHNHYVVFKPTRGKWLCVEFLTQHIADHGETIPKEKLEAKA
jgi:hypothetical protein